MAVLPCLPACLPAVHRHVRRLTRRAAGERVTFEGANSLPAGRLIRFELQLDGGLNDDEPQTPQVDGDEKVPQPNSDEKLQAADRAPQSWLVTVYPVFLSTLQLPTAQTLQRLPAAEQCVRQVLARWIAEADFQAALRDLRQQADNRLTVETFHAQFDFSVLRYRVPLQDAEEQKQQQPQHSPQYSQGRQQQ